METIEEFINFFLILVPLGAAVRVASCAVYAATNSDEAEHYKKKAKNALIYMVLAESVAGILRLVVGYLGGAVVWS